MSKNNVTQEPETIVKKKGGWLGKIIALILGMLIGIIATFGGLVGIGYYAFAKMKLEKGVNMANKFLGTPINYTQYINGEYGQKTVKELFGDVSLALQDIKNGKGSLNTLNNISPYVATLVKGNKENPDSGLVAILNSYGLNVTGDELMDKILVKPADKADVEDPQTYLSDYIRGQIDSMPVGSLLDALGYESNDVLRAICYGAQGEDYILDENGKIVMLEGKSQLTVGGFLGEELSKRIDTLPLDALVTVNPSDAIMSSLAYGPTHRYTVKDGFVEMNQLYYVVDLTTRTVNDDTGNALQDFSLLDINTAQGTCKLMFSDGEAHYLKTTDGTTFYAFKDVAHTEKIFFKKITVNDLEQDSMAIVDSLFVKDVLEVKTSSKVFMALAYGKEGVDYKVTDSGENTTIEMLNGAEPNTIGDLRSRGDSIIDDIYLSDIIDDHSNHMVMYMVYGIEGLHYSLDPETDEVTMLQEQIAVVGTGTNLNVYNEYGDSVIAGATANVNGTTGTFTDKKGVTYTLHKTKGETTLATVTTTAGEAQLYYVYLDGKEVPFDHTHLGDLKGDAPIFSKMTHRLTLADALGDDNDFRNNKILKHLADEKLDNLSKAVSKLTVAQVFDEDMYKTVTLTEGETDVTYFVNKDNQPLVYNQADGKYYIKDTTTQSERAMKGTWKYLLMTKEGGVETIHYEYTVTEHMNVMMDNMADNMQRETMDTLVKDGIIELTPDQQTKWNESKYQTIRNATISELIDLALDTIP